MPRRRRTARRTVRRMTRRRVRRRRVLRRGRRYRRRRFLVGGFTMLLVGGAAYKLGQNSVQQIEQHTGKPAEQLSEQELESAMDELGIQEEEITDSDMAAIEAEAVDTPAPSASAPSAPAPAPAAEADYIAELEKLAGLLDKGIITQEDYDAKKKSLLGLLRASNQDQRVSKLQEFSCSLRFDEYVNISVVTRL
jgi:hypothetical protein